MLRWMFFSCAILVALSQGAQAALSTDVGILYFSDTDTRADDAQYSRVFWDFSLNLGLNKKSDWMLGWTYGSYSFQDTTGTETTLTSSGMGPKLSYFIDKERKWSLAFVYFLINKGNSEASGSTSELRGSAMKAELCYMPRLGESRVFLGGKLNYYSASFPEEVVSTTLTNVSYSRSAIYPSIGLTFLWE